MSTVLMHFGAAAVWDANRSTHGFEPLGPWSPAQVIFVTPLVAAKRWTPGPLERPA